MYSWLCYLTMSVGKETIADLSKERHNELNPLTQLNLTFFLPPDA